MIVDVTPVYQLPILTIDPEFKELIPALLPEERRGLEAMIISEGCRDALITWQGILIDGHNRYEICHAHGLPFRVEEKEFDNKDDVIEWIYQNQLSRRNLTDEKRTYLIGKAYSHRKNRHGGTGANQYNVQSTQNEDSAKTSEKIAQEHNVSRATVERAETYAKAVDLIGETCGDEVKQKILTGEIKANKQDIVKLSKIEPAKQVEIIERVSIGEDKDVKAAIKNDIKEEAIESLNNEITTPTGLYHVLVVDPPWQYEKRAEDATHRGRCLYPTMSTPEIMGMDIPAEENAVLWLWTTNAFLHEAYHIIEEWDFTPKTLLTWVKDRMGTGDWLRGKTEHCIMAVRGKPVISLTNQTTVLNAPLREHSRKPDEFYHLVNDLCPGRKIDIFSRESRAGWDQWGCESDKF